MEQVEDGVQMRVHGVGERRWKTEQAPGRAAQLLDFLIEVPRTLLGRARVVSCLASFLVKRIADTKESEDMHSFRKEKKQVA